MEQTDTDPVDLWESQVSTLHGPGIAPKYFHEASEGTMREAVERAANIIYDESQAQWEILEYEHGKSVLTAFSEERSKISSRVVDEEKGLAAFVLVSFPPAGKNTLNCVALYGLRREEGVVMGELLQYSIPTTPIELSEESLEGSVLKVNYRVGNKREKREFDLNKIPPYQEQP